MMMSAECCLIHLTMGSTSVHPLTYLLTTSGAVAGLLQLSSKLFGNGQKVGIIC